MEMRDVHEYDGKIHIKLDLIYTDQEMKKIVDDAGFLGKMRVDARIMADKIMRETAEKNIDRLNNNVDARQLFVALIDKISRLPEEDRSFSTTLLEEQLCDMKHLGECPQGRTIRLWQLFQALC